ncbi:MAG: S1 RNA-binding domain-containing protein [Vampirovibrionales bacterium]|nr:S1 RNA-binding domain-containing protein [Vampirovibrionales bacterium]
MSAVGKRFPLEDLLTVTPDAQAEFNQLLCRFDHHYEQGKIVQGTVVSMDSSGAHVDIGAKMLAFVPKKEISRAESADDPGLKPGDVTPLYVLREDAQEGHVILSQRKVASAQNWIQVQELLDNETIIECTVTSLVKGGVLVDIFGLRGFLPSSQIRGRQPLESLIGQALPLKVISMDQQKNNLILSHRRAVPEQSQEQRKEAMANLAVGQVHEGEVIRLTDFGAFVNLGATDGLLPLSQMSWRWVEHPSDVLKVGDKVKVEIIGLEAERNRVSLSMKTQMKDPWQEVAEVYKVGSKVEGKITRIKNFGAFVEIFPGVEALLSTKELVDQEQKTGQTLEPGALIEVYIFKFYPQEKRIGLTFWPVNNEHRSPYKTQFAPQSDEPARSPAASKVASDLPPLTPLADIDDDDELPPIESFSQV